MTVHGAKGLEAPIVFLPDTCSTRSGRRPGGLLRLESATRPSGLPPPFLWPVKGTSKVAAVQLAQGRCGARRGRGAQSAALRGADTRARPALRGGLRERAGRAVAELLVRLIRDGLNGELKEVAGRDGRPVWRIESKQTAKPIARQGCGVGAAERHAAAGVGEAARRRRSRCSRCRSAPRVWRRSRPTTRASRRRRRAGAMPSRHPLSPIALADDSRFLRGTLIHALLEHLPTLPQSGWQAAAEAFVAARGDALPRAVRKAIVAETLAVLREPAFARAVRTEQPRRGGDRRRGAAAGRQGTGAAADRQDRSPGARTAIRC